jgi:DNA-binding NarL/FixJ family response regulator
MVLAAVDDLLFSSKIRATAKQAGVELAFARSPQEVLDQARALNPALVIFDLNSGKTDPVATIAALKSDAALGTLRVLAFASHVHTELIASARQAGADQVLPRSAFAAHLAEILLSAQSGTPDHTH